MEVSLSLSIPHGAITILVVDDETVSRRVAARMLSEDGYRVLEAASGEEAVDVLRLARGRVDLVMVDVVMPECDGVALAKQVLERHPQQRLLYMSAHRAEILMQHGLRSLDVPFLAKPYTRLELLTKVGQALERRQTSRSDVTP